MKRYISVLMVLVLLFAVGCRQVWNDSAGAKDSEGDGSGVSTDGTGGSGTDGSGDGSGGDGSETGSGGSGSGGGDTDNKGEESLAVGDIVLEDTSGTAVDDTYEADPSEDLVVYPKDPDTGETVTDEDLEWTWRPEGANPDGSEDLTLTPGADGSITVPSGDLGGGGTIIVTDPDGGADGTGENKEFPITVTPAAYTLEIQGPNKVVLGRTAPFTATSDDPAFDPAVSWSIEGTSEATIDPNTGVVTAGNTEETITLKILAKDGSETTRVITVVPAFIPVFEVAAGETLVLPFTASANLEVDWNGDGATYEPLPETWDTTTKVSHTYAEGGRKEVVIVGDFTTALPWSFTLVQDSRDIFVDTLVWGGVLFKDTTGVFAMCTSLESFSATDAPKLQGELEVLFGGTTSFTGQGIQHWDVLEVTSFRAAFMNSGVTADLSSWVLNKDDPPNIQAMFMGLRDSSNDGLMFNLLKHPQGCTVACNSAYGIGPGIHSPYK